MRAAFCLAGLFVACDAHGAEAATRLGRLLEVRGDVIQIAVEAIGEEAAVRLEALRAEAAGQRVQGARFTVTAERMSRSCLLDVDELAVVPRVLDRAIAALGSVSQEVTYTSRGGFEIRRELWLSEGVTIGCTGEEATRAILKPASVRKLRELVAKGATGLSVEIE